MTTPQWLSSFLTESPGWHGDLNGIRKRYEFKDFRQAMVFISSCIEDIETLGHHPEWANIYNTVDVTLRTHDADDQVTEKDLALAALLDSSAKKARS